MHFIVDGKLAALKKGSTFEFIAENRMFGGADGYTLSITFPLKGCPQNIDIFGHINRVDVAHDRVHFDSEVRCGNFVKTGCLTITDISETEVKAQFLEGRSEYNFDTTFDEIYINELPLGDWPTGKPSPEEAWSGCQTGSPVALPWVNDATGRMQNAAMSGKNLDNDNYHYFWHGETKELSWQLYLLDLAERIAHAVGYNHDFSEWRDDYGLRFLLVCNTLPVAWEIRSFARALPHWTVEEFFSKLELLLNGEFEIDHRARNIQFSLTRQKLVDAGATYIEDIVEEHSCSISEEEGKVEYADAVNLFYKECDHALWPYFSCDWFIKALKNTSSVRRYPNLQSLISAVNRNGRAYVANNLLYAEDLQRYFFYRCIGKTLIKQNTGDTPNSYYFHCILQPVNSFGGRIIVDDDDAKKEEIEFVPVRIDATDDTYGPTMFLSFSDFDESSDPSGEESDNLGFLWGPVNGSVIASYSQGMTKDEIDAAIPKGQAEKLLLDGETDANSEYYDRIYVAWFAGYQNNKFPAHPHVDDLEISEDFSVSTNSSPLRLNGGSHARVPYYNINPHDKVSFSFLSDSLPDPRSLFYIRNRRYVCEKLTASFSESGMSNLIKFEGYPLED